MQMCDREWSPISTAPKDGTVIDLWWQTAWDERFRVPDCEYRDEKYWIDDSGNLIDADFITHWMPRPPPPKDAGT